MFDGIKDHVTDPLFWTDVRHFLWSRSMVVLLGNAATLVVSVAALAHFWSRPYSVGGYTVVQLLCLLCQALALLPAVWPGDRADHAEVHQSVALLLVSGSWILGVGPALILLAVVDVDSARPPWGAVLFSGTALALACIASLMVSVYLADKGRASSRRPGEPREGVDWAEVADDGGGDSGSAGGD